MYLKSIEVHGFKSFANKITFEFHDGITGIVGPNGSGKSNVADAVRWVLGEQSAKQLRGAKMEDVIFSGTEMRKPLGFAYVAITLDNSDHKLPIDYEEVTVARRVYRSGESEYLINGANCRLRDVQELFLDTGIGKEGYSIIGQGQIDKILSGKPEDRRELFDEAAGITKFKKRKVLAEKNLEAERLNLSRITDILSEIEKQIGPLEKQSGVAREYLRLKEELKKYEVVSFLEEYESSQTVRREVEEKLDTAASQLSETNVRYEGIKAEYERLEKELEEKNQQAEAVNALLSDTRLNKEKLEGSMKVLREQILAARQSDQHYRERIQSAETRLSAQKQEYAGFSAEKDQLNERLDELDDRQTEAAQAVSRIEAQISQLSLQAEEASKKLFTYGNRNVEHRTNIENQESVLEQSNIKKIALNQRILKNKSEESQWTEILRGQEEEAANLESEGEKIRRSMEDAGNSADRLRNEQKDLEAEYGRARQDYMREQSRLDSMKNLAERYDGYGNSIRRVMEQKEKNPGIIGVVADIIQVEQSYETAIETALGGSIQNIVTDSEDTAKKMIAYLKQNKFGRATFLPLTAMDAGKTGTGGNVHGLRKDQESALTETGVIGVAASLVKTEARFDGLVEHLLGRTVVVDQIDHAIALAKKYRYSLRIVTLDGEQLNLGGSLSGGAYKNSSNLLGRKREIDVLQENTDALNEKCKKLRTEADEKAKELEQQSKALETYKNALQELFLKRNTVNMEIRQAKEHLEDVKQVYAEISLEGNALERQIQEMKDGIERLRAEMSDNEAAEAQSRLTMEECRKQTEKLQEESREWNEKSSALKLEFASGEQSNQFLLENMKRVHAEMDALEQELAELKQNSTGSAEAVRSKEQQIEEESSLVRAAETLIAEKEEERENLAVIRSRMTESHKSFFAKREELSDQISGLDKEVFRLNAQKERLSEQLDNLVHYMWEEYELTYSAAKEEALRYAAARAKLLEEAAAQEEELSQSARKKRIAEVKGKIRALGDVNVNAIEDFRVMNERYTLLSTQREDVIKAEEVLLGVIEDLDAEMRRQFEEKFQEIRIQFDHVFKELFGGGKGTLELMEDEDILEAGIRIIAQPPGKKLQNMMQLSGGEKALTAISLLFAIQNLKPSPFCLLDEIEAALDDSNVVRFAGYLHKLTKNTQFIVITHRRGTMNAADILYGITMQEKGVSTLVSVNLIEDKLDK